jgi:hypothetical protein
MNLRLYNTHLPESYCWRLLLFDLGRFLPGELNTKHMSV